MIPESATGVDTYIIYIIIILIDIHIYCLYQATSTMN